ncbi:fungal-specific transcription factor domain-containing protein [Xylariales sp. PMI_506]|nr:fungal-specific transcription factor domain-containing protein [Xylariales sp. PMI_506]
MQPGLAIALDETNSPAVAASDPDKPSCQGCRRRKLRCSRDLPTCTHCLRLSVECVYDDKRNKPGVKAGVIDGLSRRIEVLERAVLHDRELPSDVDDKPPAPTAASAAAAAAAATAAAAHGTGGSQTSILQTLSKLCVELCKLNERSTVAGSALPTLLPDTPSFRPPVASPASTSSLRPDLDRHDRRSDASSTPRKRRRVDACGNPTISIEVPFADLPEDILAYLPSPNLLGDIVDAYFTKLQPWIPILHETNLRKRINDASELPRLVLILHAMVVSAIRFAQPETHGLSPAEVYARTQRSRSIVVLNAMNELSVENLQALVIIAFDDIGSGCESRAWPIIGSLTRTVEYLQLSTEEGFHSAQPLLKPLLSMEPSSNWVEEEERRRVFWNIFNLDRFCSVFTGWNTSLTADDVHRRLPADGGLWHKEEPVITPFFGIWTRAQAKMGNSIAFLPAHYPSPEQSVDGVASHAEIPTATPQHHSRRRPSVQVDMSTVGAFAYCIEATESLSQVTTYFLQQRINFHDRAEVGSWLTRFKELDLRLVHWKMFLPEKWKDSNISRQPTLVNMDPNLTLAHLTHNTSMMLLHQRIAYPQPEWTNIVKLPSLCSAETCQNAALETQNIVEKYLKYGPDDGIVTNQFTFCVFVAARVMLVHWRYYETHLVPEFWLLVGYLDELAARWLGAIPLGDNSSATRPQPLATKFADELRSLHHRCVTDMDFTVDILAYSTVISHRQAARRNHIRNEQDSAVVPTYHSTLRHSPAAACDAELWSIHASSVQQRPGSTIHGPGMAVSLQPNPGTNSIAPNSELLLSSADSITHAEPPRDELSSISYLLLDPSFMDLDRVITLDEMMFTAPNIGSI